MTILSEAGGARRRRGERDPWWRKALAAFRGPLAANAGPSRQAKATSDNEDGLAAEVAEAERIAKLGRWRSDGPPWGWDSCSDQAALLLERPREELARGFRHLLRRVLPADRRKLLDLVAGALARRQGFEVELRVRRRAGGERRLEIRAAPDLDGAGRLTGFHGTVQDLGALSGEDATLHKSEALIRAIFDNSPLPIFLKDMDGRYILVSAAFARRLDLTPEYIVGKRAADVLPPGYAQEMEQQDQEAIAAGKSLAGDFVIPRVDGLHHFHAVKFPIVGPSGETEVLGGIVFDITEQRQTEEALIEAREAAEKANEAKSRFLAAASHDLRQPLQALSLSTAALAARHPDAVALETMGLMQRAIVSMGDMLNKLLDICELDSGNIAPELENIDMGDLFSRIMADFGPLVLAKGLDLRVVPCSLAVRSDPELLARILSNLVSNAIRYTEQGRVLLGCRRLGDRLRIEVHDSGIGIAPDKVAAIFQDYYQVDNQARDRDKGLGLGLGLVDRWARLLKHPVAVHSRPGRGSAFSIEVPIAEGEPERHQVAPLKGFEGGGMLCLVLEDDPAVLLAMTTLLKSWGQPYVVAATLQEAVLEAARQQDFLGLVLADYRLPRGRTGAEAVRQIRQLLGRDVPAVLITGSVSDEVAADSQELGAMVLKKPISPADLQAMLGGSLGNPDARQRRRA